MSNKPHKELPMEVIEVACQFNASTPQVLNVLKNKGFEVSHDTLVRYLKNKTGMTYEQYKDQQMEGVRIRLIQKAVTLAEGGNTTMLIFCLKNLCGWRSEPKDEQDPFKNMTTHELIVLVKDKIPALEGSTIIEEKKA